MTQLAFRPLREGDARAVLQWEYEPPYDVYNIGPPNADEVVRFLADPVNCYFAIIGTYGELVGFCCFGADARVPRGDYTRDALDIGLGVRPDLTGRGQGLDYVRAVLDFARTHFDPPAYRATIAAFNVRAQRVWERAGFEPVERFAREHDGRPFVVLMHGNEGRKRSTRDGA